MGGVGDLRWSGVDHACAGRDQLVDLPGVRAGKRIRVPRVGTLESDHLRPLGGRSETTRVNSPKAPRCAARAPHRGRGRRAVPRSRTACANPRPPRPPGQGERSCPRAVRCPITRSSISPTRTPSLPPRSPQSSGAQGRKGTCATAVRSASRRRSETWSVLKWVSRTCRIFARPLLPRRVTRGTHHFGSRARASPPAATTYDAQPEVLVDELKEAYVECPLLACRELFDLDATFSGLRVI